MAAETKAISECFSDDNWLFLWTQVPSINWHCQTLLLQLDINSVLSFLAEFVPLDSVGCSLSTDGLFQWNSKKITNFQQSTHQNTEFKFYFTNNFDLLILLYVYLIFSTAYPLWETPHYTMYTYLDFCFLYFYCINVVLLDSLN